MLTLLTFLLPLAGQPLEVESPAHHMSTTFDRGGIRVHGSGWDVRLVLEQWGRADSLVATTAGEAVVDGQHIHYDHGLVTEWYVNAPRGLEQGFTVAARPEGEGPLRLELSVERGVSVEVSRSERDARFVNAAGKTVLHYVGLLAWDANGCELAARLVAEDDRLSIVVEEQDATYPLYVDPWMGTELAMLLPNDPLRRQTGDSVAISGDTLVAGAPGTGPSSRGATYIWERNQGGANAWGETTKLVASQTNIYSGFGEAVALDGDTLAVGEPADSSWSSGNANVYVFERDRGGAGAWGEVAKIPGHHDDDDFGRALSISGDTLVVGAPEEDMPFSQAGAAYVYGRDEGGPGAWGEVARLTASTASNVQIFGAAVAVSDEQVIVGVPGDSGAALYAGAIIFFERDEGGPGAWGEVLQIRASDPTPYAFFGGTLAREGDTLLVGARGEDHSGLTDAGSVYVFEQSSGVWSETQKLTASTAAGGELFGAVSLSGDTALIGVQRHDLPNFINAGVAYLFQRQGGLWSETDRLEASNGQAGAAFGTAVAVDGNTGVAGAPGLDLGFHVGAVRGLAADPNSGAVYAADNADQLVSLDTSTGVGTPIGPLGFAGVVSLAFDPSSGTLYGVDTQTDQLLTIDTSTGACIPVGPVGFSHVISLAYDPGADILYASDDPSDSFLTIDPATGAGTLVGPTGDLIHGLAFDTSTNTLYGTDLIWDELVTIDTSTGTVTTVGKLGFGSVPALGIDPTAGVLYGSDVSGQQLITVDAATGAGTAVGKMSTLESTAGAAYVFDLSFEAETYCTAGVSASGCQAAIGATGTASASAPTGFVLNATDVEGSKSGHFYFAFNGRRASTWGNGTSFQCVEPPVKRGGPQTIVGTTGACNGSFSEDLNARWTAKPAQNPGAGAMGQAQLWYRDPQNTSNQTTSLSNAVEFFVEP
jgi:hypothetical protein